MSIPAYDARGRGSIARRGDEYTVLVQDFIWKHLWELVKNGTQTIY